MSSAKSYRLFILQNMSESKWLLIYENYVCELQYVEETNVEAILAVMNTT